MTESYVRSGSCVLGVGFDPCWGICQQGYKRVTVSAALNTAQSVLEVCGSFLVLSLLPASALQRHGSLAALGAVSLACAILSAIAGMKTVCYDFILYLRRGLFHILQELWCVSFGFCLAKWHQCLG